MFQRPIGVLQGPRGGFSSVNIVRAKYGRAASWQSIWHGPTREQRTRQPAFRSAFFHSPLNCLLCLAHLFSSLVKTRPGKCAYRSFFGANSHDTLFEAWQHFLFGNCYDVTINVGSNMTHSDITGNITFTCIAFLGNNHCVCIQ